MTGKIIFMVMISLFSTLRAGEPIVKGLETNEPPQTGTDEVINQHILSLSASNEHTRRNAAEALADFGPAAKTAVDHLLLALSDTTDAGLRMYAARALGAIGPDAHLAVPALRHALSDKSDFGSSFVRTEAATALGRIGPHAAGIAVNDLLSLLEDDNLYVRRAASGALAMMKTVAIPELIQALEHPKPEVRYRAASALAEMRDDSREALEKALDSDKPHVRIGAARAFASPIGVPQIKSVPKLITSLHDDDDTVRYWIVKALCSCVFYSEEALTALLEEMKNDDDSAFEVVVQLSYVASHEKMLPILLTSLEESTSLIVSAQLVRSIGLAGPRAKSAIPAIQKALREPQTRFRAGEALFRMAPNEEDVKRQVEEYFPRHAGENLYLGYLEDLSLVKRQMELEGPSSGVASQEAVLAARRLFSNVPFIGKTESEVLAVLGGLPPTTAQGDGSQRTLTYRFNTGWSVIEFKLNIKDGRVSSVD